MKKSLMWMTIISFCIAIGTAQAQYHPAPVYHPPAYHPAPAYHPPAAHPSRPASTYHPPARQAAPRQNQTRQNNTVRNNNNQRNNQHNADRNQHNNQHNADRNQRNNQHNAERNQHNANRNATRDHAHSVRNENKARHVRNSQRHRDYRAARGAYRNGRFNDRYYAGHFGPSHAVVFSTPGLWVGTPYASPFWWGGVQWGFGPGIFWPDAWGLGDGVFIEDLPGVGYVLADPAFPDTTVPVVADVDAQPTDEPDQQQ